ncbi:hypothetical protein PF010_g10741 [Phytophthora fragariae]|uniref:Uncharacterized protein n=1 Tax=Phytophthora fragariae TaxID=53985 RepID=A0A6A3TY99_9STRA|nr:hypothetical protein PF011_g10260 [Phytophthora fragariae]KAE9111607.1 hypothetical protein PF010_g10741 [Phytophthora fragariae]KAE9144139.1 hypothetical protein PF006_g10887 [Phytophthora fragariae]
MTDWSSALFDTLSKRAARWQHAAAERDKEVNVLEDRHEQLLLRNAQLGQQNNALRQRLVSAAARKIHRILELGRKSRVEVALEVASKQFTPTTDIAARIARALFTDLLVAEHQLLRSQQRGAWKVVNASVRSARRRQLRVAFDRLASGSAASRTKRRFLTPMHVANARAFADKLTSMLLRSGFQRWKRQFLALAIQEAEEAQEELLRALHHVTSYRQALDPYTKQS